MRQASLVCDDCDGKERRLEKIYAIRLLIITIALVVILMVLFAGVQGGLPF